MVIVIGHQIFKIQFRQKHIQNANVAKARGFIQNPTTEASFAFRTSITKLKRRIS